MGVDEADIKAKTLVFVQRCPFDEAVVSSREFPDLGVKRSVSFSCGVNSWSVPRLQSH